MFRAAIGGTIPRRARLSGFRREVFRLRCPRGQSHFIMPNPTRHKRHILRRSDEIAATVQAARKHFDLSYAEMGALVGVSEETVKRWEQHESLVMTKQVLDSWNATMKKKRLPQFIFGFRIEERADHNHAVEERVCQQCKTKFDFVLGQKGTGEFCSKKCAGAARSDEARRLRSRYFLCACGCGAVVEKRPNRLKQGKHTIFEEGHKPRVWKNLEPSIECSKQGKPLVKVQLKPDKKQTLGQVLKTARIARNWPLTLAETEARARGIRISVGTLTRAENERHLVSDRTCEMLGALYEMDSQTLIAKAREEGRLTQSWKK